MRCRYARKLGAAWNEASGSTPTPPKRTLIAIGLGGWKAAKRWKALMKFPGEVYACPDMSVYKQLKLVHGNPRDGCLTYTGKFIVGKSESGRHGFSRSPSTYGNHKTSTSASRGNPFSGTPNLACKAKMRRRLP